MNRRIIRSEDVKILKTKAQINDFGISFAYNFQNQNGHSPIDIGII